MNLKDVLIISGNLKTRTGYFWTFRSFTSIDIRNIPIADFRNVFAAKRVEVFVWWQPCQNFLYGIQSLDFSFNTNQHCSVLKQRKLCHSVFLSPYNLLLNCFYECCKSETNGDLTKNWINAACLHCLLSEFYCSGITLLILQVQN